MAPEEFRRMLLTIFAVIKSVVVGSSNQIEKAGTSAIDNLSKKRNFSLKVSYCTKEQYYELLDDLKKISKYPDDRNGSATRDYVIAFLAMPKLDEE